MTDTCRRSTCSNDRRTYEEAGAHGSKFCSDKCEVKHDHIVTDAYGGDRR